MQLKPVVSAAVALASLLQGIRARAAGSGKGRFPREGKWLSQGSHRAVSPGLRRWLADS